MMYIRLSGWLVRPRSRASRRASSAACPRTVSVRHGPAGTLAATSSPATTSVAPASRSTYSIRSAGYLGSSGR